MDKCINWNGILRTHYGRSRSSSEDVSRVDSPTLERNVKLVCCRSFRVKYHKTVLSTVNRDFQNIEVDFSEGVTGIGPGECNPILLRTVNLPAGTQVIRRSFLQLIYGSPRVESGITHIILILKSPVNQTASTDETEGRTVWNLAESRLNSWTPNGVGDLGER